MFPQVESPSKQQISLHYFSNISSLIMDTSILLTSISPTVIWGLCCSISLYLCCFILHWLGHIVISKRLSRQYRVSGVLMPPSYPLLGCLVAFYKNRRRLLDWYTELLAESPSQTIVVSRLGARRTIVTANPDNVEHVLKTRFNNYPKGRPFTEILGDFLGRGIFNTDGPLWHSQRKLASHEFSASSLRKLLVAALDAEVCHRLLPILASAASDGQPLDMQDLLQRLTFDVICRVSLGMDPGCLNLAGCPVPAFARAFDTASEITAGRGAAPIPAVWKAKRALHLGSERKLREAIDTIHHAVEELIQNRRAEQDDDHEEKRADLLSRLLSSGHDDEVIRDMVISFIMAGRDTTSSAMTWLLWLLSQNRDIEREVIREAETYKKMNYDNLKEMSFLKACLCESMRLYPPVAWDSKHAEEEDTLPDGTRVKKGDRVTYFPYGMGRMERVWGKDIMEFRPERWMEEGEGAAASPYKFPVFQAGPRVCLGKEMAFIQMKYVIAAVLKRFELRPVREERPVFVPLLTSQMAGGLAVTVHRRRSQA